MSNARRRAARTGRRAAGYLSLWAKRRAFKAQQGGAKQLARAGAWYQVAWWLALLARPPEGA